MTTQIQTHSLKLATHSGPGHVLVFAIDGEPGVNETPFAVVFSTAEEGSVNSHRYLGNRAENRLVVKGARIGKIMPGFLPEQFYSVMFRDMDEALSEVNYFFSLSETQKLLALGYGVPYSNPVQRIVKAMQVYTDAVDGQSSTLHESPKAMGEQLVELAEKLLIEINLTVSPFSNKCSAFDQHMLNSIQVVIVEYAHILSAAVKLLSKEVRAQQVNVEMLASTTRNLNFVIARLSDFIARHLENENKAAAFRADFAGQGGHVG